MRNFFRCWSIVALLVVVLGSARRAEATVGITGTADVPGQKGELEYDITIEEMTGNDPATGKPYPPNTFRVVVRMRGVKTPTSDQTPRKKFFVCMMFQLTELPGDPQREKSKPKDENPRGNRVTLSTCCCRVKNWEPPRRNDTEYTEDNILSTCWCCRKATKDELVPERNSYHLGCKEIDLMRLVYDPKDPRSKDWLKAWDEVITLKDLTNPVHEEDIESFYWDTFVEETDKGPPRKWVKDCIDDEGCKKRAALQKELEDQHKKWLKNPLWIRKRQAPPAHPNDKPDDLNSPEDACPMVKGQDTAMGPGTLLERFYGVFTDDEDGDENGVNIWAGAFREFGIGEKFIGGLHGGVNFLTGRPQPEVIKTVDRGQRVKKRAGSEASKAVKSKASKCDGKTSRCWLGTAPLGNFWTMGLPGEYAARLQGTFVGPPGAEVSVVIPGQVDRSYVADATGRVTIDEPHVIAARQMYGQDAHLVVVAPVDTPPGPMRFDGKVVAADGNPVWKAGRRMHKVTFTGEIDALHDDDTEDEPRRPSIMVTPKLGYAIGFGAEQSQFAFGTDVAYPVAAEGALLAVGSLGLQTGEGTRRFLLSAGAQYDVPIAAVPGLTIYPRATVGFAQTWFPAFDGGGFRNALLIAEAGARYQLDKRFHVGVEPVGLEVFFLNGTGYVYRGSVTAGARF